MWDADYTLAINRTHKNTIKIYLKNSSKIIYIAYLKISLIIKYHKRIITL